MPSKCCKMFLIVSSACEDDFGPSCTKVKFVAEMNTEEFVCLLNVHTLDVHRCYLGCLSGMSITISLSCKYWYEDGWGHISWQGPSWPPCIPVCFLLKNVQQWLWDTMNFWMWQWYVQGEETKGESTVPHRPPSFTLSSDGCMVLQLEKAKNPTLCRR